MQIATEIKLSGVKTPQFSNVCVVCNSPCDQFATISGRPHGFHGMIPWLLGRTPKISVPAHPRCASSLRRRLFWSRFGIFLLATTVALICVRFGFTKFTLVLAIIVTLTPFIILDTLWPPAFDLVGTEGDLTFEFRDAEYAAEFARLNGVPLLQPSSSSDVESGE